MGAIVGWRVRDYDGGNEDGERRMGEFGVAEGWLGSSMGVGITIP